MKTTKRKQGGFTLIELLVVITIIATLAGLSVPVFARVQENGNITKGINNVRQIFFGFGLYANDNDGRYPRGDTANDAFRKLVQDQLIEKEDVFGCPGSPYVPDGDLGDPPKYAQALEANENHWMMVSGLSSSSGGAVPLLFENALDTNVNPQWDAGLAGNLVRGRTWSGGRVIICTGDGSVATQKIDSTDGVGSIKPDGQSDKNIFTKKRIPAVLDVLGDGQ